MHDPAAEAMSGDERTVLQTIRLARPGRPAAGPRRRPGAAAEGGRRRIRPSRDAVRPGPRLPITTKADLWDSYPFGMLAVPREEIAACTARAAPAAARRWSATPTLTSTCGDHWSPDRWPAPAPVPARSCTTPTATACSPAASGFHLGALALGATVVPISGGMTTRQVRLIADLRARHPGLHPVVRACTLGEAAARGRRRRLVGAGRDLRRRAVERGAARASSRRCGRARRSTSTGCRRSSGRVSRPSASRRSPGCTSTRTTSSSRRSTRRPAAGAGRDAGGAGHEHADQAGAAVAALPNRRHRLAAARRLRLRPDAGADEQGRWAGATTCSSSAA